MPPVPQTFFQYCDEKRVDDDKIIRSVIQKLTQTDYLGTDLEPSVRTEKIERIYRNSIAYVTRERAKGWKAHNTGLVVEACKIILKLK